jgi:hypothetical protein
VVTLVLVLAALVAFLVYRHYHGHEIN